MAGIMSMVAIDSKKNILRFTDPALKTFIKGDLFLTGDLYQGALWITPATRSLPMSPSHGSYEVPLNIS